MPPVVEADKKPAGQTPGERRPSYLPPTGIITPRLPKPPSNGSGGESMQSFLEDINRAAPTQTPPARNRP